MATTQVKANQVTYADGNVSTTTTQNSQVYRLWGSAFSVQAKVTGSGSVAASVAIQVSNNAVDWITSSTLSLTGTGSDVKGASVSTLYAYYRLAVSGITGTGATVTAWVASAGA
jgi:hypothetical protein